MKDAERHFVIKEKGFFQNLAAKTVSASARKESAEKVPSLGEKEEKP